MKFAIRFTSLMLFLLLVRIGPAQTPATPGDDLLTVVKDGRYGFIDHTGKMVIAPVFLWANGFDNGFTDAYVCGRYVWIDSSGHVAAHRSWKKGQLFTKKSGNKVGFADENGVFKIPPRFDEARGFEHGFAPVRVGRFWGFIDESGRMAIPARFNEAFWVIDGIGVVDTADGNLLIDRSGNVLARGYTFTEGIPAEGRVPAARDGKDGFLDYSGKVVMPFDYDFVGTFKEGLVIVRKDGKWGIIDRDGHTKIPFVFDYAGDFSDGLAPARKGEDSGFINLAGDFEFHLNFREAAGFRGGDISAFWTVDDRFGYVNRSGRVIWGPIPEMPDHAPLFGWPEKEKSESCKGIPDDVRAAAERLPVD